MIEMISRTNITQHGSGRSTTYQIPCFMSLLISVVVCEYIRVASGSEGTGGAIIPHLLFGAARGGAARVGQARMRLVQYGIDINSATAFSKAYLW